MATAKEREIKDADTRLELLEDSHGKLEDRFEQFCDHVDKGFSEVYQRIDKGNREISQQIRQAAVEQNESRRFKTSTAAMVAGGVCFAVWSVFTMAINMYQQPLQQENALRKAENASSLEDRTHLNASMTLVEKNLSYMQSDFAKEQSERKMNEREVETQFHAMDELNNLRWAEQERRNAVLWNAGPLGKVSPYASEPFYSPHVAKSRAEQ